MVAAVTTRERGIPAEVPLGPAEGLPRPCVANLDSITTIPKASLHQYVSALGTDKQRQVDAAIRFAFGLEG